MTRILPLIALVLLAACAGTSEAPSQGNAVEGPTVRLGGTFRAYYGNAVQ